MFDLSHNKLTFGAFHANAILDILKTYRISKAAGIDNLYVRLLKGGTDILAIPITKFCTFFIKNISLAERL